MVNKNNKRRGSKHKFNSIQWKNVVDEISGLVGGGRVGEGGDLPFCGSVEGGLSQACTGAGGPLRLPHPSMSAGPGAGTDRGCTT